jgi:hypothetical protein
MIDEQAKVEAAIAAYQADQMNVSAGYNVIRYAQQGLLAFEPVNPGEVVKVANYELAVLQLVKLGKAKYFKA